MPAESLIPNAPSLPRIDETGRISQAWISAVARSVESALTAFAHETPGTSLDAEPHADWYEGRVGERPAEIVDAMGLSIGMIRRLDRANAVTVGLLTEINGPELGSGILLLPRDVPTQALGMLASALVKFGVNAKTSETNDISEEADNLLKHHLRRRRHDYRPTAAKVDDAPD